MREAAASLTAMFARPQTKRFARYAAVSAVNVIVGEGLLVFAYAVLGWRATAANLFSAVFAAGPAYYLSRRWVWKMSGRSHFMGEVVPFWSLALLGLVVSTVAVTLAEHVITGITPDRTLQAVFVATSAFVAYGIVWVVRFLILDRFVFTNQTGRAQQDDIKPLLDDSGEIETGTEVDAKSDADMKFAWIRRAGYTVLSLQLVGLMLWSQALTNRFALTWDFSAYHQAWWLIGHGHLDPFVTSLGIPFWRNNGEFLMWPLALFGIPFNRDVVLLWLQGFATVGAEVVAFTWVCDIVRRPTWPNRYPSWLAAGTALVLMVSNPWLYWGDSFDFHM